LPILRTLFNKYNKLRFLDYTYECVKHQVNPKLCICANGAQQKKKEIYRIAPKTKLEYIECKMGNFALLLFKRMKKAKLARVHFTTWLFDNSWRNEYIRNRYLRHFVKNCSNIELISQYRYSDSYDISIILTRIFAGFVIESWWKIVNQPHVRWFGAKLYEEEAKKYPGIYYKPRAKSTYF